MPVMLIRVIKNAIKLHTCIDKIIEKLADISKWVNIHKERGPVRRRGLVAVKKTGWSTARTGWHPK